MNLARTIARVAADGSRRRLCWERNAPTAVGGYILSGSGAKRETFRLALFKPAIACCILLMCVTGSRSQPLPINTLAGNATQGSADGTGSDARFNLPVGVTVDSAGNVYVADTLNSTVRKITPAGAVSTFAGLAGNFGSADGAGTNAQFYGPQGIAADSAGFLYVADTANATIRRISPAGAVSLFAGAADNFNSFDGTGTNASFYHPEGLAVDGAGNVYVADTWNHTIRKITPAGAVSTLAGLAENPGTADGTNSKARFNRPAGIALDSATNLFVTDFLNHTIRKITPGGTVSTIAGLAGAWGSADGTNSAARFFQPQGIYAADAATLFVVDSGSQTLRKLSASGTNWVVSTVAGLPGTAGSADGTGPAAQFYFPAGVALDGAGYLYIGDSANNTIRTTRVVPPLLQYSIAANQLVLTWPAYLLDFVLESTGTLSPGALWTPLTNGIAAAGDNLVLTNNVGGAAAFYRLHKP
jgi:sugar lactone lactonase YvrE